MKLVSRGFKVHVGNSPTRFDHLSIKISPGFITIQLYMVKNGPKLETTFVKMKDAYYTEDINKIRLKTVHEGKFEIGAVMHLARVFNHPKTVVNTLQLEFVGWEPTGKLKLLNPLAILKSMNDSLKKAKTRLSAETLYIHFGGGEKELLALLSFLDPKPLQNILLRVVPLDNAIMKLVSVSENEWRFKLAGSSKIMKIVCKDAHYSFECIFND